MFVARTTRVLGDDVQVEPVCPLATAGSTRTNTPAVWQQLSSKVEHE